MLSKIYKVYTGNNYGERQFGVLVAAKNKKEAIKKHREEGCYGMGKVAEREPKIIII
jgi:hypothetical protein